VRHGQLFVPGRVEAFRRRVVGRPEKSTRCGQRPFEADLGDAEVAQVRMAGLGLDEDVRGFDVAVDDALPVGEVQRGRDLLAQPDHGREVQLPVVRQQLTQAGALDVRHDQVEKLLLIVIAVAPRPGSVDTFLGELPGGRRIHVDNMRVP
jgi:hypothetical protein